VGHSCPQTSQFNWNLICALILGIFPRRQTAKSFSLPCGKLPCFLSLALARSFGHVASAKETLAARWRHACRFRILFSVFLLSGKRYIAVKYFLFNICWLFEHFIKFFRKYIFIVNVFRWYYDLYKLKFYILNNLNIVKKLHLYISPVNICTSR